MDSVLLDTDILSEILKNRDPIVDRNALDYARIHGQFALSSMTRFEIMRGYYELNATAQVARFQVFCWHSVVIPVTDAILDRAADLWVIGRRGGHAHNDADLIIAATALEQGRALVTGNRALLMDSRASTPELAATVILDPSPKKCCRFYIEGDRDARGGHAHH